MTRKPATTAPPPIEIDAACQGPLGMPAEVFLRDYWQKRPLLIRNAFPGFESPISPDDLGALSLEATALSRLILWDRKKDKWAVETGPLPEDRFDRVPERDWTLLVQDVDKWDADVRELVEAFPFLPRWRIDDVMISFAVEGGSVGAHIDQYDVFLLQAQGHRRWMIDAGPNPPLGFRPDVELKLLREFHATHDWVLGPGDLLYLPPGVPHHGVAEDPCLTFSVGMRAPSAAELLGDFVDTLAADAPDALRYVDPDLQPASDPYEIDGDAMRRVVEALNALRMRDPDKLGDWFGSFITQYRSAVEPAADEAVRPRIEVEWDLAHGATLERHPWSRMAWRRAAKGARLYAGGQVHVLPARDAARLAAADAVGGGLYEGLSQAGRDAVIALLESGHYRLQRDDGE